MSNETKPEINSYLSFTLGGEAFAAHVLKVVNILEMMRITKVPDAPSYMPGIINLRGKVLPVIDTRMKFGMSETKTTPETCIIVLSLNIEGTEVQLGALVDSVLEVTEVPLDKMKPAPQIGNKFRSEFVMGLIENNDSFTMLLDLDRVFSADEIVQITAADQTAKAKEKQQNTVTENEFLSTEFPEQKLSTPKND